MEGGACGAGRSEFGADGYLLLVETWADGGAVQKNEGQGRPEADVIAEQHHCRYGAWGAAVWVLWFLATNTD